MKKLFTFVSDMRVNALICCGAAVLLTACGGSATAPDHPFQIAAYSASGDTTSADPTVSAASAAAEQVGQAAAVDSADSVEAPVNPAATPAVATPAAAAPVAAAVAPVPPANGNDAQVSTADPAAQQEDPAVPHATGDSDNAAASKDGAAGAGADESV